MGNGMNKILNGLYLGNFRDSRDPAQLTQNCITHIVSIHDNAKPLQPDKVYLCLPASDTPSQDLTQYFSQCNDFIHRARLDGGSVLVHWSRRENKTPILAGVSRSSTIVVAYVMSVTDMDYRSALDAVRGARNCASPNFGFQRQLLQFQYESVEKERQRLVDKFGTSPFSDKAELLILLEQFRDSESRLIQARGGISYTTGGNPRYVDDAGNPSNHPSSNGSAVMEHSLNYARKAIKEITDIGKMRLEERKKTENGQESTTNDSAANKDNSTETQRSDDVDATDKDIPKPSPSSSSSNGEISSSLTVADPTTSDTAPVEVAATKHVTDAFDNDSIAVCLS